MLVVVVAFDKMGLFLFYGKNTDCFCHVYQMQINWDFFYSIRCCVSVSVLQSRGKFLGKYLSGEGGTNYGTRGQRCVFGRICLVSSMRNSILGVEALVSIKSHENRFDLSLCFLCGQTLMKTTISALTSK